MLSYRQQLILKKVVEGNVELGSPVGSKWISSCVEIEWGPSTVRAELAQLESAGLLSHPHTSAGRAPTDIGYRAYADMLFEEDLLPTKSTLPVNLTGVRRELDVAVQKVAHALAQMTELLAIVQAPSMQAATIRHVEVLLLKPKVVAVVVITSTGGVLKRLIGFKAAVDQGLVDWAASYLNERLQGIELGAHTLASKVGDEGLDEVERGFIESLMPAFSNMEEAPGSTLYMEGASHLLGKGRLHSVGEINDLMQILEHRYVLLSLLKSAIDERRPFLRIGSENEVPELHSLSIVAANYGLAHRNLGTVSVIGPVRMDYASAIGWVRDAAHTLSGFIEDVY